MKRPLWTHPLFAAFVAVAFLAATFGALKVAAHFVHSNVDPLQRIRTENTKAILLLILAMLLMVAALAVPLVIRRKAQQRIERDNGANP